MICQVTKEKVITSQCRKIQREVLAKFCYGCSWHKSCFITKRKRLRWEKSATKKKSHKIFLPGYTREFILKEAAKEGVNGSQMIVRLLGRLAHEGRDRENFEATSL